MSADVPVKKLKSVLNDKISKDDVNIGKLIVPQIFEKKKKIKDGHLVTEESKIEGFKIKLLEIRQKMLDMCLHTDDEIGNMDKYTILIFLQSTKPTAVKKI